LIVFISGIGPDDIPPVLERGIPDGLKILKSIPIPPPVIKHDIALCVRDAHSSLVSSSAFKQKQLLKKLAGLLE
jgi:hypothetical protein